MLFNQPIKLIVFQCVIAIKSTAYSHVNQLQEWMKVLSSSAKKCYPTPLNSGHLFIQARINGGNR